MGPKPMERRDFLRGVGLGIAAAAMGSQDRPRSADAASSHPHIVYILVDDLGYGDVGCLNPECKIPTPNMDRLAKAGMAFTDAHSASALCTPTRYGILTGRYCWRSPLKLSVTWGYSPALIPEIRLTVASFLKKQHYRTACIGKWHLGLNWATIDSEPAHEGNTDFTRPIGGGPNTLGFDYFYGIPASLDMDPYVYIQNDRVEEPPTQLVGGRSDPAFYRGGLIAAGFSHIEVLPRLTNKAVACIERHASGHPESPLFLYFPLSAPHVPFLPTKEFRGKSGIGVYGDFVHQVDWTIGQVMNALERVGMAENTLVIVTSDNGCTPKADFPALASLGHHPSYHFRGYKADIYEGGHRIPFIARWPARIEPGTSCDQTICLNDLMATAAEIVGEGFPDNAGEDSVSLLPALFGTASSPLREAIVHHSSEGYFSIRQAKWKLELCPGSGGWSYPRPSDVRALDLPPVQLYDLSQDIGERKNLQAEHPKVVQRLTRLLEKYVADGRSTPGLPQKNEGRTSIWGPPAGGT